MNTSAPIPQTLTSPLNPYPDTWFGTVNASASMSTILTVLFFIIFMLWLLHTVIAIFHWFRYAHRSWLAVPAVVLHLSVSAFIILFMVSGLR